MDREELKAVFLSINFGLLPLFIYLFFEIGLPTKDFLSEGWLLYILFAVIVYLIVSILGWIIIGVPVHLLVCKYFSSQLYQYLIPILAISILLNFITDSELAIFLGFSATIQAILFWLFVYKKGLIKL